MTQLSDYENQQVELGLSAERLMSDATFSTVMTELSNVYMSNIINSKDGETTKREGFYHMIKALQDIGHTLSHWVQVKENIMANLADAEQPED